MRKEPERNGTILEVGINAVLKEFCSKGKLPRKRCEKLWNRWEWQYGVVRARGYLAH